MAKYNFTPYHAIRAGYVGCSVGNHLYVSAGMLKKMDYPKYFRVQTDSKNKAILLVPAKSSAKDAYRISARIEEGRLGGSIGIMMEKTDMDKGRYTFVEQTKEGYLCVQE